MWKVKKNNYEYSEMRKILYVHDDADNNWIFLCPEAKSNFFHLLCKVISSNPNLLFLIN